MVTMIPSIACIGVIGRNNKPLHMSIFPSADPSTGAPRPIRTALQFSLLLSSTLDIFDLRSRAAVAAAVPLTGDYGLLHAVDERLAAYGHETNTGVKLVVVVDMRGRRPGEGGPAAAGPMMAAAGTGPVADDTGGGGVAVAGADDEKNWRQRRRSKMSSSSYNYHDSNNNNNNNDSNNNSKNNNNNTNNNNNNDYHNKITLAGRSLVAGGVAGLGVRDADVKVVFRAVHAAYVRLLQNPFHEPDEHSPPALAAAAGATGRPISSRRFEADMRRIGEAWTVGITSLY